MVAFASETFVQPVMVLDLPLLQLDLSQKEGDVGLQRSWHVYVRETRGNVTTSMVWRDSWLLGLSCGSLVATGDSASKHTHTHTLVWGVNLQPGDDRSKLKAYTGSQLLCFTDILRILPTLPMLKPFLRSF